MLEKAVPMDGSNISNPLVYVLLLEDDTEDRLSVANHLETMGFKVFETSSPLEVKDIFEQSDFSLVLMHIGENPKLSLEICGWIRAASTVPILMLTSRTELVDEKMALAAGADDYITKPIESKILTSRIIQQLKRGQNQAVQSNNFLNWYSFQLDLNQHIFTISGKSVALTNTEFQFLQLLMGNPDLVFTRQQILKAIGVMRGIGTNHIVDSHASRLRAKIRANGGPEVITVIRSVGFRLSQPVPSDF